MVRIRCHYCTREVGSVRPVGALAPRPHNCPHGVKCPGGTRFYNRTTPGLGPMKCQVCKAEIIRFRQSD